MLKLSCLRTHQILDSVASNHICHTRDYFSSYWKLESPRRIKTANGYSNAIGIGDITVHTYLNGKSHAGIFKSVLHLPTAEQMLISVAQLSDSGIKLVHTSEYAIDLVNHHTEEMLTHAHQDQNLYQIQVEVAKPQKVFFTHHTCTYKPPLALWLHCLSHISEDTIQMIVKKGAVTGMEVEAEGRVSSSPS